MSRQEVKQYAQLAVIFDTFSVYVPEISVCVWEMGSSYRNSKGCQHLSYRMWGRRLGFVLGRGWGPVIGFSEHGNE